MRNDNSHDSTMADTSALLVELLSDPDDPNFSATKALVRHLRQEADLSQQKADRLNEQARMLSVQFGVTQAAQDQYAIDPTQLPPLDENGVPKYKGKKRGRKPKARKRKINPNRRKRQQTAYTLFVQETYPRVKAQNPELPSNQLIRIVAGQWKTGVDAEQKQAWKLRALAMRTDTTAEEHGAEGMAAIDIEVDEMAGDGNGNGNTNSSTNGNDDVEEEEQEDEGNEGEEMADARIEDGADHSHHQNQESAEDHDDDDRINDGVLVDQNIGDDDDDGHDADEDGEEQVEDDGGEKWILTSPAM
uniref:HMG box domain-containing protein n=1 Tax=Craspedostauros australis TaxID=1486917 RepID=A0A7R9WXW2_9STRA|mmetsp:Transcript_3646/g.9686  ORF Transcript_3646/g.9686 Transcript_3646/m.9686 type:complete len:303 (+) Transcript_3646:171-1079(+)